MTGFDYHPAPQAPARAVPAAPTGLLTASRLSAARRCARLHHLRYVEGYRPVADADTLRFGTLVHRALEAWWTAAPPDRLSPALDALAGHDPAVLDPYDLARAQAMMIGYDARWTDDVYEVLAVEAEFEGALINPATGRESQTWRLAGKVDAIARCPDGLVRLVEHKTSSEDIGPGSDYWRRLRMDGQVSMYYEGALALGYGVAGCVYDVLGKPAQRVLRATPEDARKYTKDGRLYANQRVTDESPAEYRQRCIDAIAADPDRHYQRGDVVRLDEERAEAMADVWMMGRMIRENQLAGRAPRNPDGCVRWSRNCEFFDVCSGVASLDDVTRFVRSEDVHSELAERGGPNAEHAEAR